MIKVGVFTLLVAGSLGACGDPRVEWREQVRLQNGDVLVLVRTAKFIENWIPGGGGGSINKGMTLNVELPAGPDIPTTWNGRFVPIVFDRDPEAQEWFIVATFFHCDSWHELGRPKLPYTEYRFRNGHWVQRALDQKWIGRGANVFPADLSSRQVLIEAKPALTLRRKDALLSDPAISPEFKRIVDRWPAGANC